MDYFRPIKGWLKLWLHEPRGIQTTSITVREEGKTDRSALRMVSREKLEDGRFRTIYRGEFRDDSFANVVANWLKRHGARRRGAKIRKIPLSRHPNGFQVSRIMPKTKAR